MPDDREIPPADLRALARERSQARRERRFGDADRIRALIEEQGWDVVDRGAETRLRRAHPMDVVDQDGVTRYGWSGAVPEATDQGAGAPTVGGVVAEVTDKDATAPTVGGAEGPTVALRALPEVAATDSLIARLVAADTRPRHVLVVVGEGCPDPTMAGVEVVRLRGAVAPGTLVAVALRRVVDGPIVVGERWPADATPQDVDALAESLGDPAVAVVGLVGARSADLRRFAPGGETDTPLEAVGWAGLTFRARDGRARLPVDEGFTDPELLAAWWSLTLRDDPDTEPAADDPGARGPRRAVAIRSTTATPEPGPARDDRATRRDRYRLIDRFAGRDDLLIREDTAG